MERRGKNGKKIMDKKMEIRETGCEKGGHTRGMKQQMNE